MAFAPVKVIRYVRPYTDQSEMSYSNLGGATFVFDLDYNARKVEIKFAICATRENFSKELGTAAANMAPESRTFDLDKFQKLSDSAGGFVDGYLRIVETEAVLGTLMQCERTLIKKMKEQNLYRG
jgi:hypothetical protein